MELSRYQQRILKYFVEHPKDNMLIEALAGSGKTFMNLELTKHSHTFDVYLAFNNSVAEEFKQKVTNPKVRVYTIHSLAYNIMMYNMEQEQEKKKEKKKKPDVQNLKPYKILNRVLDEDIKRKNPEYYSFLKSNYVQLYTLCRLTMTNMHDQYDVEDLIISHNLFFDGSENEFKAPSSIKIVSTLCAMDAKNLEVFESDGIIDFTDMLYITYWKLKNEEWEVPYWAMFTNIFADEAQDFSLIQLNFLKFIKRKNGRYVFTGDGKQAICFYAGADAHAFSAIPKMFAPMKSFPLPITYRCAESHVRLVNRECHIPLIARPNAPYGKIYKIEKDEILDYIQPGDMVVSRKNKWIPDVILDLVYEGIPIYMQDKDFVNKIKKLINTDKYSTVGFFNRKLDSEIESYYKRKQEEAEKRAKEALEKAQRQEEEQEEEIQEDVVDEVENEEKDIEDTELEDIKLEDKLEDKVKEAKKEFDTGIDNLEFLYRISEGYLQDHPSSTRLINFKNYVDKILCTIPTDDAVRVTSVHKAKGLEANNVFVLNQAKVCPASCSEQRAQEKNLSYISITRAKENLYLVREPMEDKDKEED